MTKTAPSKRYAIIFQIPGIKGSHRVHETAMTAEEAQKNVKLGYGCDILIDNVIEMT